MGSFWHDKFMARLRTLASRLSANQESAAISAGLMGVFALAFIGVLFQLIASVPVLLGLFASGSAHYRFFITPYFITTGLIAVFAAFAVAFHYARSLGLRPLVNGLSGAGLFLLVAAPLPPLTFEVFLPSGLSPRLTLTAEFLGMDGLFVAIVIALLSVRFTQLCINYQLTLRLARTVPAPLRDAALSAIPFLLNVLIWHGTSTIVQSLSGMSLPGAIAAALAIPLAGITSVPGVIFAGVFCCLLTVLGIPGLAVLSLSLIPAAGQAIAANAAAVTSGNRPEFYAPLLLGALFCAGGIGNPIGLILHGLRSKSEHLRTVSRAAIVPALFNLGEPALFGFPVLYNPILLIPYLLSPLITMLLAWLGYLVGFFQPAYVQQTGLMPLGTAEFLGSMAWQNIFLPVVGVVVSLLVFYPFLRLYEGRLLEPEELARADK